MILLLLATLVAVVAGFAVGGRLNRVNRPPLIRNQMLGIALVAQFAVHIARFVPAYEAWLLIGLGAMTWYAVVNRGRPGLWLAVAGLALNAIVVFANGGMPVSVVAAERAGITVDLLDLAGDPLRKPMDDSTALSWLAEGIPLALPVWPTVLSVGDVLFSAGFAVFIFSSLTGVARVVPERIKRKDEKKVERLRRKNEKAAAVDGQAPAVNDPTSGTTLEPAQPMALAQPAVQPPEDPAAAAAAAAQRRAKKARNEAKQALKKAKKEIKRAKQAATSNGAATGAASSPEGATPGAATPDAAPR